jgi:hypothetical protein
MIDVASKVTITNETIIINSLILFHSRINLLSISGLEYSIRDRSLQII